jgi:hypothetical protein
LSRPERSFESAGEALLAAEDLGAMLSSKPGDEGLQQALACYFAAGDGWREAEAALRGAFANQAAAALRLSGRKAE